MGNDKLLSLICDTVLDNGLKVICLKKSGAPVVSVQVWYKTGSVNEHDGMRGISHFFEHMMFRGSKHFNSEEHSRRINDVGGHCNAFTTEDVTAYLNNVPSKYLDLALELEADRMSNLTITREILDTERNVIIEEFQGYMNNPVSKAFLEFRKVFYKDHPYSVGPLGTIEDIRAITVSDCMEYYQNWYTPGNAVAVIVGDIGDMTAVMEQVNATLGAAPASRFAGSGERQRKSKTTIASFQEGVWMKRRVDFDVPFLILGYPAPSSSDSDALPLEILQMIISQGETGRMHREIVRRQSIAVMAGGLNQNLKLAGMSLFFAVFTPDISIRRIEKAMIAQIESIKTDGISQEEMEKIKNSTLTNRVFELYSTDQICQRLGHSETVDGGYKMWVKRLDDLDRLDRDRLVESANKYWDEPKRHTLYLQPKKIKPLFFLMGLTRRFTKM
jgi:zinc protease